jgi:two-component system, cell cycle response regulator
MVDDLIDFGSQLPDKGAASSFLEPQVLLNAILQSSLDGIAVWKAVRNKAGKILAFDWILANPIAADTVGQAASDLPGTRVVASFPGFHELFKDYVELVESGRERHLEFVTQLDTRSLCFDISASKIKDGLAITFRDVTELKELSRKLELQSKIDSLTKIANRASFNEAFDCEWRHSIRVKRPFSLILCDLDHFKRYNDRYGVQRADYCLQQFASLLSDTTQRPRDFVARFASEEFAIILSETPQDGAKIVTDSFQFTLANLKIPHSSSGLSEFLTASFGIATITPTPADSSSDFLALVESALLAAKDQGGNCIVVKEPGQTS